MECPRRTTCVGSGSFRDFVFVYSDALEFVTASYEAYIDATCSTTRAAKAVWSSSSAP